MTANNQNRPNTSKKLGNPPKKSFPAPQIIKSRHGGARLGSGRPQRRPLTWPSDTDLMSAKGFDAFLCRLIESTWKENVLDSRVLSSVNGTIKLLLDLRHWVGPETYSGDLSLDYPGMHQAGYEYDPEEQKQRDIKGLREYAASIQAMLDDPACPKEVRETGQRIMDTLRNEDADGQLKQLAAEIPEMIKTKIQDEKRTLTTQIQATIDDPSTTPEQREKAEQLLERIQKKLGKLG